MKNKKSLIVAGVLIILLAGGQALLKKGSSSAKNSGNIGSSIKDTVKEEVRDLSVLFYGSTCPHCIVVEEWLAENAEIEKKAGLIMKEVYEDKNNSAEMTQRAKECGVATENGIGVPFLYDNGTCLMGDQPIIDYLKETYGK